MLGTSFFNTGLCLTSSDLSVRNLLHRSPVTATMLKAWLIMMVQNVHCTALGVFVVAFSSQIRREYYSHLAWAPVKCQANT